MEYQDEQTTAVVNELFQILFAIKPAFRATFKTQEELLLTKKQWFLAFMDAKISSIEQLKRGITHCRMQPSPFFPSPGDFIAHCALRPEDVGAPSVRKAFEEAMSHDQYLRYQETSPPWSHPCVKFAYEDSDPHKLRSLSSPKAQALFECCYQVGLRQYMDGKVMNQIDNTKTKADYQEYVGRLKSDIRLKLAPADTEILSFPDWMRA